MNDVGNIPEHEGSDIDCIMDHYHEDYVKEFYDEIMGGAIPFCNYCLEILGRYVPGATIQGNL